MARAGLATLIARWRRLGDAPAGDDATGSDDEAQELLDAHGETVFQARLQPMRRMVDGVAQTKRYLIPYADIEEAGSGEDYFRVYDSIGTTIEPDEAGAGYTVDYAQGAVVFAVDQEGFDRYVDLRVYDLNAAAAEAWRERAGAKAGLYAFSSEGSSFQRQQWFDHCEAMARRYDQRTRPVTVAWERTDVRG